MGEEERAAITRVIHENKSSALVQNGRVRVECAPPVDDGGLDILQYEVEVRLCTTLICIASF